MDKFFNEKLMPGIMKFVNTKAILALRNGMLYTMPLTILGSIFLILTNFPWQPVVDFLQSMNVVGPMNQAVGATFDIIAIVGVVGIAYEYVKNEGHAGLNAGVLALVSFLILQESFVVKDGLEVGGIINKAWTGGRGMIAAIIIGLVVGWIYSYFLNNDIRIKFPEGVPSGVVNSFAALIPGIVIMVLSVIVYGLFKNFGDTTVLDAIYRFIQIPLEGMTDSLGGVIMMGFIIPFMWFFGIHGSSIVGGIMGPILQANTLNNKAILDAGHELTIAAGGRIVTQQFLDQYMTVTGAGMTIGIVIFMVFFAKSARNKEIGKLSVVSALFNINEPIIFGTPIVLNPLMAVPFIAMPIISGLILYFAQYTGLVPLFGGVTAPWTTPPIISGFLVGGWKLALLQLFNLTLSFFVYYPFIKKIDRMNIKEEQEAASQA
ncbi:PTS sugar transporter subunit IIC [Erysipelothrix sp. HDW6C]|uniref:PTS sugar transporter subunit IIC n=1 Tax=Erysipelothrix sp. HDW6C TaxID=2714930 RepID=UPI0014098548|nr:PTS sugar transporter subunit IIC [Erysipelothrix sp. HDW6C]QIK70382.1 PTS sugar transporter subunit IIC [Erysipelothrix sp. HDW6C]